LGDAWKVGSGLIVIVELLVVRNEISYAIHFISEHAIGATFKTPSIFALAVSAATSMKRGEQANEEGVPTKRVVCPSPSSRRGEDLLLRESP